MISKFNGDILKSGAPVILHQVNCLGVMGVGLAKQIRNKHPSVYTRYKDFAVSRTPDDLMGFSLDITISLTGNSLLLSIVLHKEILEAGQIKLTMTL